jgi:hypothetical protein
MPLVASRPRRCRDGAGCEHNVGGAESSGPPADHLRIIMEIQKMRKHALKIIPITRPNTARPMPWRFGWCRMSTIAMIPSNTAIGAGKMSIENRPK